jgi:hypothetical protein
MRTSPWQCPERYFLSGSSYVGFISFHKPLGTVIPPKLLLHQAIPTLARLLQSPPSAAAPTWSGWRQGCRPFIQPSKYFKSSDGLA